MTPGRHKSIGHKAAAALVALLLLALVGLLVLSYTTAPTPARTVDELVSSFRANRAHFDTISSLASVEATFGIQVASGSFGSNTIDASDVPRYSEVLASLNVIGAQHLSASGKSLDVTVERQGLAVSGRESGYYYTTDSDVETVSLDVASSPEAPNLWLYPLGGGWYASEYRF